MPDVAERIKKWDEVFGSALAEQARVIHWVRLPVTRNSIAYRRLMSTVEGRTAYCVFLGLVRIVARERSNGRCTLRGAPITAEDLSIETSIPRGDCEAAMGMLRSRSVGWIVADGANGVRGSVDSRSIDNRSAIDHQSIASNSDSGFEGMSSSPVRGGGAGEGAVINGGNAHGAVPTYAACAQVWSAYPKRAAKAAFVRELQAACMAVASREFGGDTDRALAWIGGRVEAYAAAVSRWSEPDRRYIPHGHKWLADGRYDDDEAEWSRPADDAPDTRVDMRGHR